MSGRYSLISEKEILESRFNIEFNKNFLAAYNVAPTKLMPVITAGKEKGVSWFYWGITPEMAKNKPVSQKLYSATDKELTEKFSFKKALVGRRCIIPADGYYEWKKISKKSQIPYRVIRYDNKPFSFAGIWDEYEADNGEMIHTFRIITTQSNSDISEISNTMPVIFGKEQEEKWLNPNTSEDELISILKAPEEDILSFYSITPLINSPTSDGPALIEPAPPVDQNGNYTLFQ
ncbi:SOS response-associated peptidase [Marinigracilibium pacificum]|uniref:Abasic site processing protein n=1 Tax=Marinigracilibium pacificum TaxID=2729599 RepID=A0A848J409_9BACT|nr:SOS response-associated peptidase [Marinigracilibium pacificum]NMM49260.1 SOS response-associated peptidase [Marinigracilibium pacificum]